MIRRVLLAAAISLGAALAQEHGPAPAGGHAEAPAHGAVDLTFWKWANFAILAGLLGWAIAKHAPPFFAARIAEIQKDINEARQTRTEAEARAAGIEKRLSHLDAELAALRSDARREMEVESGRIQDETRRLVAGAGDRAALEIASMSKAAESALRQQAASLALELAEKKLKAKMSPEADAALAGTFLAGLQKVTRN